MDSLRDATITRHYGVSLRERRQGAWAQVDALRDATKTGALDTTYGVSQVDALRHATKAGALDTTELVFALREREQTGGRHYDL